MATHPAGGLKHAAAEPGQPAGKHERRTRGVVGRTATLRRAPSDSDCSAETASLSADSGDRVPRPPPPVTRSAKSRSRRRGSEWEVLEGLKDGQRFDKRPEVFNGYLHKKRKWPLKGWHKRFFVVDGGILVYARSPTDVARGRLHGSVDVGLSVISAKQRRRRIDIDADEFIYHLRAKTADVFRTWLNVLKVHRLYRQHLLTFGARESVPKINTEELPPTEGSRTSLSSLETFSTVTTSEEDLHLINPLEISILTPRCSDTVILSPRATISIAPPPKHKSTNDKSESSDANLFHDRRYGLCQSNLVYRCDYSNDTTLCERQIVTTDLGIGCRQRKYCVHNNYITHKVFSFDSLRPIYNTQRVESKEMSDDGDPKLESLSTFFCFMRKKRSQKTQIRSFYEPLKSSKKSTNLVRYRNVKDEPTLKGPLSNCLLLGKYKVKLSKEPASLFKVECNNKSVCCNITGNDMLKAMSCTSLKPNIRTPSECEIITNTIYRNLFEKGVCNVCQLNIQADKLCVRQIVRDLYEGKSDFYKLHPVLKAMLRELLENFIIDGPSGHLPGKPKCHRSACRSCHVCFTNDKSLANSFIKHIDEYTQYEITNDMLTNLRDDNAFDKGQYIKNDYKNIFKVNISNKSICTGSCSRVQELERLLKNTIYVCDSYRSPPSREKDIEITKILINNIANINLAKDKVEKSKYISSELPKIQQKINAIINECEIPTDVATQLLNAYLNILLENKNKCNDSCSKANDVSTLVPPTPATAHSIDATYLCAGGSEIKEIYNSNTTHLSLRDNFSEMMDEEKTLTSATQIVGNESFKQEKSIGDNDDVKVSNTEQTCKGQIVDVITSIFTRATNEVNKQSGNNEKNGEAEILKPTTTRVQDFIRESQGSNPVFKGLSKYRLENIVVDNDSSNDQVISVTMKLRKDTLFGNCNNQLNVNIISQENPLHTIRKCSSTVSECLTSSIDSDSTSKTVFDHGVDISNINFFNPQITTRAFCDIYSDLSSERIGESSLFQSNNTTEQESMTQKLLNQHDCSQSCYLITAIKKRYNSSKSQTKKKVYLKDDMEIYMKTPQCCRAQECQDKVPVFDKAPSRDVDEKFVLLLLENIVFMSRDMPQVHKDLNNVYLKLKKKHEKSNKEIKTGLSLLGRIYDEPYGHRISNKCTQVDCNIGSSLKVMNQDNGTSCEDNDDDDESVSKVFSIDKGTSAKHIDIDVCLVQTELIAQELQCLIERNMLETSSSIKHVPNLAVTYTCKKTYSLPAIANLYDEESQTVILGSHIIIKEKYHKILGIKKKYNKEDSDPPFPIVLKPLEALTDLSHNQPDVISDESIGDGKVEHHFSSCCDVCCNYHLYHFRTFEDLKLSVAKLQSNSGHVWSECKSDLSCFSEAGGPLETTSRELGQAQLTVQQLQRLLDALELQQVHHDTDVSLEGASPNVKKDRRKFGLRKKKSNNKCASVELAPSLHIDGSSSHMALSALTAPPSPGGGTSSVATSAASLPIACAATRPQSLPGAEILAGAAGPTSLTSLTPDQQLREDFTVLAKDLLKSLKSIVATLVVERGRLRAAVEGTDAGAGSNGAVMAAMRTNLTSALHQNSELRSRLSRIHDASDLAEISSVGPNSDAVSRQFQASLSYSSSCVSASEFFDAEEHDDMKPDLIGAEQAGVIELDGDSSSEAGSLSSEEGSASSDNSDGVLVNVEPSNLRASQNGMDPAPGWGRRKNLPNPRPTPGGPSLWNLLYKNIGKDLSQISMPVTINEPLNMLQRLCEELEYSELLDAAAECKSAVERMCLVAAFAVSVYAASAHRAASKPFNPLLGETYECVRDDRGFRFIAEQVSHHPPISACHAESPRWSFWQEARIKTKFWGKSMEFQPAGRVHVRLHSTGDLYSWNKVTTCVHNLFGGQRWVDQYGDMHLMCHGTDITCKLNFIKASSWSSNRHEVRGAISCGSNRVRISGRWSEALYAGDPPAAKCLWRPGAMPPEHELYYGFTRFAMELNEMEPGMKDVLPKTDTRFRPDQRALEEGDVDAAERNKLELEQAQRERRRDSPDHMPRWFRKRMEGGEEMWVFAGEYWKSREAGFPHNDLPSIW